MLQIPSGFSACAVCSFEFYRQQVLVVFTFLMEVLMELCFAFLAFLWKLLNSCCTSFDKDVQMLGAVQIMDVVSLVASTKLCWWLDFYGCIDSAFQMKWCWILVLCVLQMLFLWIGGLLSDHSLDCSSHPRKSSFTAPFWNSAKQAWRWAVTHSQRPSYLFLRFLQKRF